MSRAILPETALHPAIRSFISTRHADIVDEVRQAIENHPVVVVGMAQNPFPKRARKLLNAAGISHCYLEYGSYLSQWRRRNALKMWTGWPTFPMIFVDGQLIGGAKELETLLKNGELPKTA